MCDHLSRLTAKQFPSIIPFAYLCSKSFVVGYLIFGLLQTICFGRIPYALKGSFNPCVTTNKELHIRTMEIQPCQRMWFLKSRFLYAGFYCIDIDQTEPSMSSHPRGRKTPSCLLTDEDWKREFVQRSKGLEGRRGGRGGWFDTTSLGEKNSELFAYWWGLKAGICLKD